MRYPQNIKHFTLLCTISIVFLASCKKDEKPCTETPQSINFIELGGYGMEPSYWLQNIDDKKQEVNLVITTQSDYEKYVVCSVPLPAIDFTNHTLLAGRMKMPSVYYAFPKSLLKTCNTITYNVELKGGVQPAPKDVCYFALIPKTGYTIIFNVYYQG